MLELATRLMLGSLLSLAGQESLYLSCAWLPLPPRVRLGATRYIHGQTYIGEFDILEIASIIIERMSKCCK